MITNLYKTIKAKIRASSIKEIALNSYEDILSSCMKVTAVNHSLCFILRKRGIFGGPVIEVVEYPKEVVLSEFDTFVVIRRGIVYKLEKNSKKS